MYGRCRNVFDNIAELKKVMKRGDPKTSKKMKIKIKMQINLKLKAFGVKNVDK